MCDKEKYDQIYQDISCLQPEDTLQMILESKDQEEKTFYEMIGNYLLQKKQRKAIQENLF